MAAQMTRFILELSDPITGEVSDAVPLDDAMMSVIEQAIDMHPLNPGLRYPVAPGLLNEMLAAASVTPEAGDRVASIRMARWFDALPYTLHTGRELTLMRSGMKPLAAFTDDMPDVVGNGIVPESIFEPYVATGQIVRRQVIRTVHGRPCRDVLYALSAESWRIDAYLLVLDLAGREGWSPILERMQGRLLGYTDEQNDAYQELSAARHL